MLTRLAVLAVVVLPTFAFGFSGGATGYSGITPGLDCSACHAVTTGTVPTVNITGPSTLGPGAVGIYTLTVTGGPGVTAGMNVAASIPGAVLGGLAPTTKPAAGEVVQVSPLAFAAGKAEFQFSLTAPSTPGPITLFGAGNSCNGAGPAGDRVGLKQITVTVMGANTAPTVTTAASATPRPVVNKTTALAVTAADDAGEAALIYTWAATAAAAPVTFSVNGTNAAKNTTATFSKAGSYTLVATIQDAAGLNVTSSVTFAVNQTLTAVTLTPPNAGVPASGTQQFTANGVDQFGAPMTTAPTFTWTVSGGGAVSATGLFTAGATLGGPFTVTASSGGKNGTATVTVAAGSAPTVATAAAAAANPTSGTTAALSVRGADDGGEPALTYTWAAVSPPAAVTFSVNGTNAAKNTVASFTRAGSYPMTVTIKDAGNLTVTSSVTVTVNAALATVTVSPATATVAPNANQLFTFVAKNQFGTTVSPAPTATWTVSGGGTIGADGSFRAASGSGGPYTITATVGAKSGTASVTVSTGGVPSIAQPPSATPALVLGKSTTLRVVGDDDGGEAQLSYQWSAVGAGTVTFSANNSNGAKTSIASFSKAGPYTVTITIADAGGTTMSTNLEVSVDQTLSSIEVGPASTAVAPNATRQFSASAKDQFNDSILALPMVTWAVSGGGFIDEAGLFTARDFPGGPFVVSAVSNGIRGTALVSVGDSLDDTLPPQVSLTAPGSAPVSGSITLRAEATDDVGVAAVDFLIDGESVGTATSAPWTFEFNTRSVPDGVHVLEALARDVAGNLARSQPAQLGVSNSGRPIAPAGPGAGAGVTGDVSCSASSGAPLWALTTLLAALMLRRRRPI